MAGDWIQMRTNLFEDPRVARVSTILCPREQRERAFRVRVLGCLYLLWSLADQHTTDGYLRNYSAKNLDDLVETPGFAAALAEVGWLDIRTEGIAVKHFREYNGTSAKERAQGRKRVQKHRGKSQNPVTLTPLHERYTGVTEPLPQTEKTDRREEKRIEECSSSSREEFAAAAAPISQALLEEVAGYTGMPAALEEARSLDEVCVRHALGQLRARLEGGGKPVTNPGGLLRKMLREHAGCRGNHPEGGPESMRDSLRRIARELEGIGPGGGE